MDGQTQQCGKEAGCGRRLVGCRKDSSILDGPRMSQRRGHGEAQARPLPKLERSWTPDPRVFQEVVAESEDFKEGNESGREAP